MQIDHCLNNFLKRTNVTPNWKSTADNAIYFLVVVVGLK